MKISICITVLNEEKSIKDLLQSLVGQTIKPYEIVIVDGGSKDNTLNEISKIKKSNKLIKVIKTKKTSISQARNIGIQNAKGDIIALTDAGCIPKSDWLEEITKPFEDKSVGLVAGFYEMPYKTSFQEAARLYLGIPESKFDEKNFLPSARSVAFTKKTWGKVGGFDEKLEKGGEDSDFFYKCVKHKIKIIRAGKARVVWKEIETLNLPAFLDKIYVYAKGDGQAGIWWHPGKQLSSHNLKISLIFVRYFLFALVFLLGLVSIMPLSIFWFLIGIYVVWSVVKQGNLAGSLSSKLWLPILQITSDFSVMTGFLTGILGRK